MMIQSTLRKINYQLLTPNTRWRDYLQLGKLKQFVEFTIAVNCLTEYLNFKRLPGLMRLCERLENSAMAHMDEDSLRPMKATHEQALAKKN